MNETTKNMDEKQKITAADSGNSVMEPIQNTDHVPALILNGVTAFPYALTPLVLSDPAQIAQAEKASESDRLLVILMEMPNESEFTTFIESGIFDLKANQRSINGKKVLASAMLVRIVKLLRFPDSTARLLVRGIGRVDYQVLPIPAQLCVKAIPFPQDDVKDLENIAMGRTAARQFQEVVNYIPNFPEELKIAVLNMTDCTRTADMIADTMNLSYAEKLVILAERNLKNRLHLLMILLNREVEVLRLGAQIQNQVQSEMTRSQREFFLREQMRQISEELGEGYQNPDVAGFLERMKHCKMPESVRAVVMKETERLNQIPQAAAEYNIAYTYVDWLLNVPWNEYTHDNVDVKKAAEILEADHYGLKDVKERILEFLSVLQLKRNSKAAIICFVGPPGVGKTSLGKSIASSLGRKFVRMSLGGIKDEAEIRGHRRTYVGALPGRIIQGMKRAGTSNPVFMLDELDKVGSDYRGDPSSALLEVLDPEQNSAFNDHYLEVDYDLSKVMFIATANVTDTIPKPLLDRMEVIRLPGYTLIEKEQICKRYLIPRQMKENGLDNRFVRFTRKAALEIIRSYTAESGVRNLERTVASVCRKLVRQFVETNSGNPPETPVVVDDVMVRNLLGAERFLQDESENIPRVGVATGMAWTSVGGCTLNVEAVKVPGKGELLLTGSLGAVMKESAQAAFTYVRGHAKEYNIPQNAFTKNDFHIHVPDGATPKDGPSAGVTLTTALVSLLSNKPVRPRLSMTGEITLRGKVTAIGGVREKVIAALSAGIVDVILPKSNEKDLEDVPDEVKNKLKFHFVSEISEVLEIAMPPHVKPFKPEKENEEENEIYTYDDAVFREAPPKPAPISRNSPNNFLSFQVIGIPGSSDKPSVNLPEAIRITMDKLEKNSLKNEKENERRKKSDEVKPVKETEKKPALSFVFKEQPPLRFIIKKPDGKPDNDVITPEKTAKQNVELEVKSVPQNVEIGIKPPLPDVPQKEEQKGKDISSVKPKRSRKKAAADTVVEAETPAKTAGTAKRPRKKAVRADVKPEKEVKDTSEEKATAPRKATAKRKKNTKE